MRTGRKIRMQTIAKACRFMGTYKERIVDDVNIAQLSATKMAINNNLYNLLQAICNILQ